MASQVRTGSSLAKMATEVRADEFVRLVSKVSGQLANENGRLGNLKITGRLVEAEPVGEVIIIGDLHGDLKSLAYILDDSKFLKEAKRNREILLVFLGDYGDRGINSPEVYYVVLKLKEMFPEKVILMRGNHEGPPDLISSPHDLPTQTREKFKEKGSEAYLKLKELFSHLYIGVIVNERFILLHGGAPSQATTLNDVAFANDMHPWKSHLEEILWNDPCNGIKGTIPSPRGAGRLFGVDITNKLLSMLNVKAMIRGHQSCADGYRAMHGGQVITLFSRKGPPYNNIFGAYLRLIISEKLESPKQLIQGMHKF